jgi:nucleoside-diphosphate-sugar epimerase
MPIIQPKKNKAVVFGGGGFIGSHLVKRLKLEGYWVRAIDLKKPEFSPSQADDFIVGDLRDPSTTRQATQNMDEVYQLAADMGGMGFISGKHDADIMHNSALINLNTVSACQHSKPKIFFSSSACVYPQHNQNDPNNPICTESSTYPASPDSEYGWEKLFSERLYQSFARNYTLNIRIARFHNIFGPEGTWRGGREKAPAALCRKVAEAQNNNQIEVWGPGDQTRSFLYINECLEGIRRLMQSNISCPINIGSDEMISINDLAKLIISISNKNLHLKNVPGPEGVRGRSSDNTLIKQQLNWSPSEPLRNGISTTYQWIEQQINIHQHTNNTPKTQAHANPT